MLSGSYVGVKGFSQPFVPARVAFAAAERRVALVIGDRAIDGGALVAKIVGDRPGEARVGELMRRIGKGRLVAARELVLTLRPASIRRNPRESAKSIAR